MSRRDRPLDDPLRELEVITKIEPRFLTRQLAYDWYRSRPLPGFSGATAMQLVAAGRAAEVIEFIEAADAGVYA
jgi:hypothetical protein